MSTTDGKATRSVAGEAARLLGLLLKPRENARDIYTLLGDHHLLGEQSMFLNLGY